MRTFVDFLGWTLDTLTPQEKEFIILRYHMLTYDELAAALGLDRAGLGELERSILRKLRRNPNQHYPRLDDLLEELLDERGPVPSAAFQALAARAESIRPAPATPTTCASCEQTFWPMWQGRPRKYCSNACRQAAYRRRRGSARRAGADRAPE